MAMVSEARNHVSAGGARKRALLGIGVGVLVVVVVVIVAALVWSGVTLASDSSALAKVSVQPLGGTIEHVSAYGPGGRPIPLRIADGRLTPLRRLRPGEQVSVHVEVRRPGWLGWALGAQRSEQLTLQAPVARVTDPWMTVHPGSTVHVSFDEPVSTVAYGSGGDVSRRTLGAAQRTISLGAEPQTGTTEVAVAARSWETVGPPTEVSWFPPSRSPVMVTLPAAGAQISPATRLHLTFSQPVSEVLGSARPRLSPSTPGHWHEVNSHTLVFTPSGFGAAFDSQLQVALPRQVAVTSGIKRRSAHEQHGRVDGAVGLDAAPAAAARTGRLPACRLAPRGRAVARTPSAEAQAAVDPPSGTFSWRYGNTPHQLEAMWTPGQANTITKGAVMKFEDNHAMTVDGLAGSAVWRVLLGNAIAGEHQSGGYSYVYVHREVPEEMTLWHDGHTVISSPANTGISGAETDSARSRCSSTCRKRR